MNEQLEKLYKRNNDIWGLPQIYKGIDFYPIKVKDEEMQHFLYRLFAQPKNHMSDKRLLKMTYLKYLLYLLSNDTFDAVVSLKSFLEYITKKEIKIESKLINPDEDMVLDNISLRILIGTIEILEGDFEDIREIILEQNGMSVEYVEQFRPDLEEKLHMSRNTSDINFADEIFTFAVMMKKSITEIGEYTMFQLQNQMERLFTLENYELFKPLEASGQISSKSGAEIVKPYLYHIGKKGRYDSILVSKDKFLADNKEVFNSIN